MRAEKVPSLTCPLFGRPWVFAFWAHLTGGGARGDVHLSLAQGLTSTGAKYKSSLAPLLFWRLGVCLKGIETHDWPQSWRSHEQSEFPTESGRCPPGNAAVRLCDLGEMCFKLAGHLKFSIFASSRNGAFLRGRGKPTSPLVARFFPPLLSGSVGWGGGTFLGRQQHLPTFFPRPQLPYTGF